MFRFILLASVFIAATYGAGNAPEDSSFESFKAFHGKRYANSVHEATAKSTFQRCATRVAMHNTKHQQGKATYRMELNQFSDMEPSVFNRRNGYKKSNKTTRTRSISTESIVKRQAPSSFDWRTTNKVSPVKDQGQCGSCWAFSTTGAMEAQQLIANETLVTLSEEQIVDCDTTDGGCNGGNYETAWQYIQSNGGLDGDAHYPYLAGFFGFGGFCYYRASKSAATISGYQQVDANDAAIVQALTTYGPVSNAGTSNINFVSCLSLSISLDASQGLQHYSSGILSCPNPPELDHAVLLVGYTPDYWIVKNSWGTSFGMKGYFQLARGTEDCGMTQNVAYPQLGPTPSG